MMILMFNGEGAYDGEDNHNDIPDICLFSYTSAIWGQEILHLKVGLQQNYV